MAKNPRRDSHWSPETEEAANKIRASFAACRALGHQWEPHRDYWIRPPVSGYRMSVLCRRCGMVRNDLVDGWGQTMYRSYRYPEGYLFDRKEVDEIPPRAVFKLHLAETYGSDLHAHEEEP